MNEINSYKIKLPQFEGPFDLLLFFIERDELDIYNIPITSITNEFLEYIQQLEHLNIELASEFILFVSTLMRIKARMLIPRKELDNLGKEIDPRQELIDKILEYKRYKQASEDLAMLEGERLLQVRRGNVQQELALIGEESSEGTEVQTLSLFKLMKTFERVIRKIQERQNKPQHIVFKFNYTMEESRVFMLDLIRAEKNFSFEKVFALCKDRIHAIFLFLSLLELVQQKYVRLLIGEGKNNFILEALEPPQEDINDEGKTY